MPREAKIYQFISELSPRRCPFRPVRRFALRAGSRFRGYFPSPGTAYALVLLTSSASSVSSANSFALIATRAVLARSSFLSRSSSTAKPRACLTPRGVKAIEGQIRDGPTRTTLEGTHGSSSDEGSQGRGHTGRACS